MPSRFRDIIVIVKKDRFVYSNDLNQHHYFAGDPVKFNPHTIISNENYCMYPDQPLGTKHIFRELLTMLKNQHKADNDGSRKEGNNVIPGETLKGKKGDRS